MATSFPEIGVQTVLRDFYIFQRDIRAYNRLVSEATSAAVGSSSAVSAAQSASVNAANAAARADLALTEALEKEAQAAFATEKAMQSLQKGSQSRSATAHEEALAHAENAIALQKEASAAAANALQARNTAGAAAAEAGAAGMVGAGAMLGELTTLAGAFALVGAAGVAMGAHVQSSLQGVASALQVAYNATQPLIRANENLAASYGQTVTVSAHLDQALARDLDMKHKTVEATQAAAEAATVLAKATGEPLDAAMKLVAVSTNAFDLDLKGITHTADVWSTVLNTTTLDARTAVAAFGALEGSAKALGLTFEQTAALEATVAAHGDALSRMGLDLSRVITSLINPSSQAAKILNEQGLVMVNARTGAFDLAATLSRLDTVYGDSAIAAGKMTQAQREQELAIITGQSGVRVLAGDVGNLSKEWQDYYSRIKAVGQAQKDAAANTNTLTGEINKLKAAAGFELADSFTGPGRALQGLVSGINQAIQASEKHREFQHRVVEVMNEQKIGFEAALIAVADETRGLREDTIESERLQGAAQRMGDAEETVAKKIDDARKSAQLAVSALKELETVQNSIAQSDLRIGDEAISAQYKASVDASKGQSTDKVQQAKIERDAVVQAAAEELSARNAVADQALDKFKEAAATEREGLLQQYQGYVTVDYANQRYANRVMEREEEINALRGKYEADYLNKVNDANAKVQSAEESAAGAAATRFERDSQTADNSARSQIESVDKIKDTFLRDIDQMYNKYADDTKKMAKAFEENYANAVNREMEQLAQAETQIADAQAAEQLRIAQRAAREELNIKIQAQRDAFDDLKQRAQDAFNFQERLTQDQLSDKIQAERDAFNIQQEMLDKGVDAATIAKTQEAMATAEGNQLKNTHLSAAQKAQIQSDYATNQKLYAQQIASTKATIQKDADKNTAREKFDAQLRAEQEAADDAATLRREAFDRDARTRQEAFDLGIEKEQQALEDQFAQQALDQQIKKIHQHEDAIRSASVLELEHMRSVYNNEVTARNQALATDLANLEQHFKDEMSQFDQHWADLAAKQIAHDSAISAREAQLTKNEVDNANIAIRAYNAEAEARANALGLAKPNPVAEITAIPEPVQIGHNGLAIGGLPGTEHMIRALAGEMVIQPASLGLSPSNNYNSNTVNNNYAFHANYSHAQSAQELRHDVMAIMALTRGGR